MKVLFISHPDKHRQQPDFPPIGIAYLGGVVHDRGHEVLLIDSGLMNLGDIVRQVCDWRRRPFTLCGDHARWERPRRSRS